jgi:hypothetical protein
MSARLSALIGDAGQVVALLTVSTFTHWPRTGTGTRSTRGLIRGTDRLESISYEWRVNA